MNFGFWLRLICAVLLRFGVLLLLGLFYQNFEVSPLPAWTFTVFVYLLLFLTTYLFTRWVFGKQVPTRSALVTVLVSFLVIQTILETLLYLQVSRAPVASIIHAYGWPSLLLLSCHFMAIIVASIRTRRQVLRSVLSEGMSL